MRFPEGPSPVTFEPWSLLKQWRRMQRDPLLRVRERFERYGDIYRIQFLGRTRYVMRHPAHHQAVLVDQASAFEKPTTGPAARQLRRFLGEGLLTSNGELWRRQRRVVQPSFHKEHLACYAEVVTALTLSRMASLEHDALLDVSPFMMSLTLAIVNKTLFNLDLSTETERVARAIDSFRATFDGLSAIVPEHVPYPSRINLSRAILDLDHLLYSLIDRPLDAGRTDLLSLLVGTSQAGRSTRMARKQIRDELVTLLVAGHETTSHALSWTLHLLSQHPEVEAKLHDEVDRVLRGRPPALADLASLPYAEQILSEALRLFPPAYVVLRTCTKDTEVGGYTVPRGTDMVLWIYHTHRDGRWYEDPDHFLPERFSPERRKKMPACTYLPFGAGQRTCIGKQFALMEAQLILALLAQHVAFRADSTKVVKPNVAVTLAPRELRLRIHRRQQSSRHRVVVAPREYEI